jgi:hypothetical protein
VIDNISRESLFANFDFQAAVELKTHPGLGRSGRGLIPGWDSRKQEWFNHDYAL